MQLATRNSAPVLIVTAGSSTTEGYYLPKADRWPTLLAADLQRAYPLDNGVPSPATPPTPPPRRRPNGQRRAGHQRRPWRRGLRQLPHVVGHGPQRHQVGDLDPAMVIHQPVTGDFHNQTDPATTKANIEARIAAIDAAATTPPVHVLLYSYSRWDFTASTYDEQDYVDVLNEIAAEHPDRIMVIDLHSGVRRCRNRLSSDRSDSMDMMYDSTVHMNATGMAFLEDLILAEMGFSTDGSSVAGAATTPSPL